MGIFILSGIINAVSAIIMGLLGYLRNPKNIAYRVFALMNLAVAGWATSYAIWLSSSNATAALFWTRSLAFWATLIPIFYLHWILSLLGLKKKLILLSGYILTLVFVAVSFTPYYVLKVEQELSFPYWPKGGIVYLLYIIFVYLGLTGYGFYHLFHQYPKIRGHKREQIKYAILGSLLGFGGGLTNFPLWYGVPIPPYGNMLVFLYVLTFGYAMLRYRLMDIRLLTLKLVAYSSAVALLIGGLISAVALVYVKYQLITNLYLLMVMAGFSSVFGFFLILKYFPKLTDKIFAKGRYNPQELRRALDKISLTYAQQEDLTKNWLKTIIEQMKITRAAFILTGSSQVSQVEEVGFKPFLKKQAIQAVVNYIPKKNSSVIFNELEDSPFKNLLRKLGIEMLLPVKTKNQTIGILALGEKKSGDIYNSQDLNLLEEFGPKAAVALERSKVVTKVSLLYKQAEKIITNEAIKEVLDTTIDSAFLATESEGGSIMLLDEKTKTLSIKASRGIPKKYHYQNIKVGEGIAGWVTLMREPMIIDSKNEKFKKFLKRDHIHSSMCVPLEVKDKLIGVLSINRIKNKEAFTKDDCDLVTTVATNVAQLIENARFREEEVRRDKEVINVFIKAVEARDPYTSGHSQAVTKYAVVMAKELGLSEDEIKIIETASKLHDIGKIGIPDQILNKPGKLTEEEWQEIKKHPEIGEGLIMQYSNLEEILPIVRYHHESYDGSGYPTGIAGEVIPLGARILAVADAFNAMTSKRPYREALPLAVAIKELKRCSGTQFDPEIVEAFLRILERDKPLKVVEDDRRNSNLNHSTRRYQKTSQNSKKAKHLKVIGVGAQDEKL